jgi:hypothetical protein
MSQTIAAAPPRPGRLIAPAAILAPVLTTAAFMVVGSPPADDATAREVVTYYEQHGTGVLASSILLTLAAAALVWFAAQLQAHVRARQPAASAPAAALLGAAVLIGAGFTIFAGIEATAATTVDHLTPESMQTLNALDNGMFYTVALGAVLLYASLAVASLRHDLFPRAFGWVAAGLATVSLTPAFIAAVAATVIVLPLLGRRVARDGTAA